MVVLDSDVLNVARLLLQRYATEAKRHALHRIWELSEEGDQVGCELWAEVANAIDEIQASGSAPDRSP